MKITLKNYQKLLKKIQQKITTAQENIVRNVNRQKVVMSWEIGREIDVHLKGDLRSEYGSELFKKLQQDTQIELSTLYQMHAFYKTYPQLPKPDKQLNWSHYRNLVAVKNDEVRNRLEELVVEKNLGSNRLKKEISAVKKKKIASKSPAKLRFTRGQLFTYALNKDGEIDLGFNIFLTSDQKISAVKKSDYTYVATLERVVDGDTIHVKLDLGFGVKHHEILRLAKIDAAAADTKEGKKATEGLKKILKDVKFLIVKTNKTDIYGRYIADVFFDESGKEKDPQKVAQTGTYLNQILLDKKLAEVWVSN